MLLVSDLESLFKNVLVQLYFVKINLTKRITIAMFSLNQGLCDCSHVTVTLMGLWDFSAMRRPVTASVTKAMPGLSVIPVLKVIMAFPGAGHVTVTTQVQSYKTALLASALVMRLDSVPVR